MVRELVQRLKERARILVVLPPMVPNDQGRGVVVRRDSVGIQSTER